MTPRHELSQTELLFLTEPNFAVVSTLRSDGSILSVPAWVDVDGHEVLLNSEIKRAWPNNAKERGVVTVLVSDRTDPYRYVAVSGRVVSATTDDAFAHGDRMAQKYLGKSRYPFHSEGDVRILLRVSPDRVSSSGV